MVAIYSGLGYQSLPSRRDEKRPYVSFGKLWEARAKFDMFERWPDANVQVMAGVHWGLVVIDLDGVEAVREFGQWFPGGWPRTWTVENGGDGRHLWFSLPPGRTAPVPSGRLWSIWEPQSRDGKCGWRKHVAIERLCDRKLVMAPPSIHPKTRERYRFTPGLNPLTIPRPAPIPQFLLDMPVLQAPVVERPTPAVVERTPVVRSTGTGRRHDSRRVLEAIHDKVSVAVAHGLRVASRSPNAAGWISVYRVHADDANPSASFSVTTGRYMDMVSGESLGLFDLLVRLGAYPSWLDAVCGIGDSVNGRSDAGPRTCGGVRPLTHPHARRPVKGLS